MNRTISIIRIAVLCVLFTFGMIFLFGEEQDESSFAFLLHVCVDKALAFAALIYASRLYKRWSKADPWFIAYKKMCDEVMNESNLTCIGKESGE